MDGGRLYRNMNAANATEMVKMVRLKNCYDGKFYVMCSLVQKSTCQKLLTFDAGTHA